MRVTERADWRNLALIDTISKTMSDSEKFQLQKCIQFLISYEIMSYLKR